MATKRADEKIRIGADTSQAESKFKRMSGAAKAAIVAISAAAIAAATGLGAALVRTFREQERAEIRLRRTLVSTGRYSAELEQRIHAISERIAATGAASDQAMLLAGQGLIQFANVADDQLDAAMVAIAGISKAHGESIESVVDTVAESLNDMMEEGTETLGEVEKWISAADRERLVRIKNEQGAIAVQRAAIELLNETYRENLETVSGSTAVYTRLGNTWTNIKEELGRLVHLLVGPLAEWIASWLPSWVEGLRSVYVEIAVLGEAWDVLVERFKAFFTGDTSALEAAVARLEQARERIRAGMIAGGASTTGAAVPTPGGAAAAGAEDSDADRHRQEQRLQEMRDREAMLRATLEGMAQAEIEYRTEQARLDREASEARRLLLEEETRAEGEARLAIVELERQIAEREREEAEAAALRAAEEEQLEQERQFEIARQEHERALAAARARRAAEAALNRQFDARDMEAMQRGIRTRAEIQQAARDAEIAAFLESREEMIRLELEYGETNAAIIQAVNDERIGKARDMFGALAGIHTEGSDTLSRISRFAARAQLLIDLATKPFEAYAKTSAAFPWPLGPALGAAHFAVTAATILNGLRSVGSGGGGGGAAAAARPAPRVAAVPVSRTADVDTVTGRSEPDRRGGGGPHFGPRTEADDADDDGPAPTRVIHVSLEVDGNTLAQTVQEVRALAENN